MLPAPAHLERERAFLAVLLDAEEGAEEDRLLPRYVAEVNPGIFSSPVHARVWAAAKAEVSAGRRATAKMLMGSGVGSLALAEISESLTAGYQHAAMFESLVDLWQRRRIIDLARSVDDEAHKDGTADVLLEKAQAGLTEIVLSMKKQRMEQIESPLTRMIARISEIADGKTRTGIFTGFHDLDEITGGWKAGDMIVLAGRPRNGKTSIAMNIVREISVAQKKHSAVFSLEMEPETIAGVLLAGATGVPVLDAQAIPRLTQESWDRIAGATGCIATAPVYVSIAYDFTIAQIRRECRALKALDKLDFIVIDHLGLVQPEPQDARKTSYQQITERSRAVKILARELEVPVLILCQLNRECEKRDDKRPRLSDLRESGAIEQDADQVLFIQKIEDGGRFKAEIRVEKNRCGREGISTLEYEPANYRFFEAGIPRMS